MSGSYFLQQKVYSKVVIAERTSSSTEDGLRNERSLLM